MDFLSVWLSQVLIADPNAMDESGRTARPNRNKPGVRTFDARREQIVERVAARREDYLSTRRFRSARGILAKKVRED
jgi:hypothetical protein